MTLALTILGCGSSAGVPRPALGWGAFAGFLLAMSWLFLALTRLIIGIGEQIPVSWGLSPAIGTILSLIVVLVMITATLLTMADRKWSALMQDRVGPNRARFSIIPGLRDKPLKGIPHIVADVLKMLFKEDFIPEGAVPNRFLFNLAPMLAQAPAAPARAWRVDELGLVAGLWLALAGIGLCERPLAIAGGRSSSRRPRCRNSRRSCPTRRRSGGRSRHGRRLREITSSCPSDQRRSPLALSSAVIFSIAFSTSAGFRAPVQTTLPLPNIRRTTFGSSMR